MTLFKKLFGHERSASGKTLDRTVLIVILIVTAVALYACYG
jgi:hypothetical protein